MSLQNLISDVLYCNDPMNTGCVENFLMNEYFVEAGAIASKISSASSVEEIKKVVRAVFDLHFWKDCVSEKEINQISLEIKRLFASR